jgi:hypothetical protein
MSRFDHDHSCAMCQRALDPEYDLRYVVHIQVYLSGDSASEGALVDDDRDHLQEIGESLEQSRFDGPEAEFDEDAFFAPPAYLCASCRKQFVQDPLGRRAAQQLDFSKN